MGNCLRKTATDVERAVEVLAAFEKNIEDITKKLDLLVKQFQDIHIKIKDDITVAGR